MSRIEQIITEIEDYIDSCKFQPLSNTKILVNKEEIEELLVELRLRIPEEIKKYQKIISNKDAILEDAQAKADAILAVPRPRWNNRRPAWLPLPCLAPMHGSVTTKCARIRIFPLSGGSFSATMYVNS